MTNGDKNAYLINICESIHIHTSGCEVNKEFSDHAISPRTLSKIQSK